MDLNALVRQQIAHAYANAPAIRAMMDAAGVKPDAVQSVADLAHIPVTSKERLQELQAENPPFGGFLAVPLTQLSRIYLSPGPIYDPQGIEDPLAEANARQVFSEAGFTSEDIVINTFMYHMVPAGLALDAGVRIVGATVVPLGPGNIELQIKVMLDLKATGYLGTPSFLQMIYDKAKEMGLPPSALPLKKAFFAAEPYLPSQRQVFEGEYGLVTSQAYATADLGIIGYERPGKAGWYIPQSLLVQICSPESGEELPLGELGEVVVTTMNPAYPLIRFGTGDLSIMEMDGQDRKLKGWMGRSGEAVKVRGMFLHPNSLKAALAGFPNVSKFQAVVGRDGSRDTVTLNVVLSEGALDKEAVMEAIKAAARLSINAVEVVSAEQIEGSRIVRDARDHQ
jgi:phenylacetate-CoA ligase